jgi:anti-sigma regulatory factor (Ser/Thr protein kinase)
MEGPVTTPGPSGKAEQDDAQRVLVELNVPSEPGNERLAMERVAEAVKELGLPTQRLERLKTAVAEATMNAMEHGNRCRPEVPVKIQVLTSEADLLVRITDQGGSPVPDSDNECRTWRPSLRACRRLGVGVCSSVRTWSTRCT